MDPAQREVALAAIAHEIGLTLKGQVLLSSARNQYLLDRIARTAAQVVAAQAAALAQGQFAPAYTQVRFGQGPLSAITLKTPGGQEVQLHGVIDRIDLEGNGPLAVIFDYKTTGGQFHAEEAYHGLSLQLLAALLASRSDSKLEPVGAFFVPLLRKLKDVRCPDDALAPDDPGFPLRIKPRGFFDERCAQKLDRALSDGSSSVFNCKRNNDGQFSKTSDVVTTGQFSAILEHASRIMGWLSGQLLEGDISIRPYRLHEQSPCSHCEYKPVCRFELGLNRYRFLEPLKREDALKLMQTKGGAA